MIDRLRRFFAPREQSLSGFTQRQLAKAALLAEAARLDGTIHEHGRAAIERGRASRKRSAAR